MDKINFQNGVSGNTPLNATNLNKIQDNVESAINEIQDNVEGAINEVQINLKGTILYKDATGTADALTLNDAIENFAYFEIESYVVYNGVKVYSNTGKLPTSSKGRVHLNNMFIGLNKELQVFNKRLAISGTNLTINSDRCYKSVSDFEPDGTYTFITKIIGYY